ncbi:MAG: tetratricopeptide repeat protein [Pirellulales bacterium]
MSRRRSLSRRQPSRPPAVATISPSWKFWLQVALLLAAVVVAYGPAVSGEFIWDDDTHLTRNILTRQDGLYRIWFTADEPNYWPLTWTSYWFELRLFGPRPTVFHITNILLHVGVSLLLWKLLAQLKISGAWLVALLFAIHPANVESVAWIAQRKTLLSGLFGFASLACYLEFDRSGRHAWHGWAIATFLLAMLSKGSAAPLPLVLLVLLWFRNGQVTRRDLVRIAPLLLIALAMAGVEVWFQSYRAIGDESELIRSDSFWSRLAASGWAVWWYLYKAVWPADLAFVYPRWQVDAANPISYLPGVALVGLLWGAWRWRRRDGGATWSALMVYGLILGPVLGFVNIYFMRYSLVADHYQYLALPAVLAWCLAAARLAVHRAFDRSMAVMLGRCVAAATVIVLAWGTWRQCHIYADDGTLFRDTIAKNPNCWMAYSNLGQHHLKRGELELAERLVRHSLQIFPDNPEAHNQLARLLLDRRQFAESLSESQEALRLQPSRMDAQVNRGLALAGLGRLDEAEEAFTKVLRRNPQSVPALVNLGNLRDTQGRLAESLAFYQQAASLDPTDSLARRNLASSLAQQGRFEEALAEVQEILRQHPQDRQARALLERIQRARGNPPSN